MNVHRNSYDVVDGAIFLLFLAGSLGNGQLLNCFLTLVHGNECFSMGDMSGAADLQQPVWTAYLPAHFLHCYCKILGFSSTLRKRSY